MKYEIKILQIEAIKINNQNKTEQKAKAGTGSTILKTPFVFLKQNHRIF